MSLDVYLTEKIGEPDREAATRMIFVREDGQTREITRAEWDERYSGIEPVSVESGRDGEVYWANITHNLNTMADEAGIYKELWRPDEIGITHARQLIAPLADGLGRLRSDPAKFKRFNPKNGWGDYNGLVRFVAGYLQACREHPNAEVSASR